MSRYCLWFALLTGLCFLSRYAIDIYKNKLNITHNCKLELYYKNSYLQSQLSMSVL